MAARPSAIFGSSELGREPSRTASATLRSFPVPPPPRRPPLVALRLPELLHRFCRAWKAPRGAGPGAPLGPTLSGEARVGLDGLDLAQVAVHVEAEKPETRASIERAGQEVREDHLGEVEPAEGLAQGLQHRLTSLQAGHPVRQRAFPMGGDPWWCNLPRPPGSPNNLLDRQPTIHRVATPDRFTPPSTIGGLPHPVDTGFFRPDRGFADPFEGPAFA